MLLNVPFAVASRSTFKSILSPLELVSWVTRIPLVFSKSIVGAPSSLFRYHVAVASFSRSKKLKASALNTGNRRRSLPSAVYSVPIVKVLLFSSTQWSRVFPS